MKTKKLHFIWLAILCELTTFSCKSNTNETKSISKNTNYMETKNNASTDTATFGAGCFWCVEAVFQQIKGVDTVISGYSGGHVKNPAYREVCNGTTGHAEVCQIVFNPQLVSYDELLEAFWLSHDPTTLNRQGNDTGTQYRSAIFYHNDEQKQKAESYKEKLNKENAFGKPVVTEIAEFKVFYKAEDYHQNYFNLNGEESYCRFVVGPKVDKFKKVFSKEKLK
ncbi:MAG: peptide-methionine (S)-S-oxide reductase MsrA [Bacteroidota bacterium]